MAALPWLVNPSGVGPDYVQQNAIFIQTQVDEEDIERSRLMAGARDETMESSTLHPALSKDDTDVLPRELAFVVRSRYGRELTSDDSGRYPMIRTSLNGIRSQRALPGMRDPKRDAKVAEEVAENLRVLGPTEGTHRVASIDGSTSSPRIGVQVTGTGMTLSIDPVDVWQPMVARPATTQERTMGDTRRYGTSRNKAVLYARPWVAPSPSLRENQLYSDQVKELGKYAPSLQNMFAPAGGARVLDPVRVEQMARRPPVDTDVLDGLAVRDKQYMLIVGAIEQLFKARIAALVGRLERKGLRPPAGAEVVEDDPDKHMQHLLLESYTTGLTPRDGTFVHQGLRAGLSQDQLMDVYADPVVKKDIELVISTCMAMFQVSFRNILGTSLSETRPGEGLRILYHPM